MNSQQLITEKNKLIKQFKNIRKKTNNKLFLLNEKLRITRAHEYIIDCYDKKKDTFFIIESNLCKKLCEQYNSIYRLLKGPIPSLIAIGEIDINSKSDDIVIKSIEFDLEVNIEINDQQYTNILEFIKNNGPSKLQEDYDINNNVMFSNIYSDALIMDNETINYPQYADDTYENQLYEHSWHSGRSFSSSLFYLYCIIEYIPTK